jgi:hypothetical protein
MDIVTLKVDSVTDERAVRWTVVAVIILHQSCCVIDVTPDGLCGGCGKSQVDCVMGVVTLYQVNCLICMEMLHSRCLVFSKQTLFPSDLKICSKVSLLFLFDSLFAS